MANPTLLLASPICPYCEERKPGSGVVILFSELGAYSARVCDDCFPGLHAAAMPDDIWRNYPVAGNGPIPLPPEYVGAYGADAREARRADVHGWTVERVSGGPVRYWVIRDPYGMETPHQATPASVRDAFRAFVRNFLRG